MTRIASSIALAALVVACTPRDASTTTAGTPTAIATTTATATTATADASSPVPDAFQQCFARMATDCRSLAPKVVACPPTIEGTRARACGWSGVTAPGTCTYGTTRCECALSPYCGGPAPPPSLQYGMVWSCRAPLGPDECPRDSGEATTAKCSAAGKKCAIEECASRSDCTCTSGAWKCNVTMLPPRP